MTESFKYYLVAINENDDKIKEIRYNMLQNFTTFNSFKNFYESFIFITVYTKITLWKNSLFM